MTSIAVTASVCASTSEVALIVASFLPFSLAHDPPKCQRSDEKIMRLQIARASALPGMTHRLRERAIDGQIFNSEHPTTSIRLI
jgi:hypothetical protein